MRAGFIVLTMSAAVLAACSGDQATENKAEKAASLQPGQYEVTSEVTAFEVVEPGEAAINTPVGTRATASVCVGNEAQVNPALFANEGLNCQHGSYYARNGRMNMTMNCSKEGAAGNFGTTVEGTFQADSFEATRSVTSYLQGGGDVQISSRLTGRRTGECQAQAPGNTTEAAG